MRPAKRACDIAIAACCLLAGSPLLLAVALAVLLDAGRPVLFRQQRVGRHGRSFEMLKFRTMRPSMGGPLVTSAGDPRITRSGRFLRGTKLDELPQLWNVLRGEMSLVGPRPEVRRYVDLYTPEQARLLDLVPGITDPASLAFFDEERILAQQPDPEAYYIAQVMPAKIRINLAYADRATTLPDLGVLARTVASAAGRLWGAGSATVAAPHRAPGAPPK
jgi:lipopolysaccharide/colanic/teichoic acid biosynthesis glycosyltransferase